MDETGMMNIGENELLETDEELQAQLRETYLTFWLDKQVYGLSIAYVVQIIGVQEITKVPNFPYYAKGIISLRGEVLPVIDLRLRLGGEEIPYTERTCIIVMRFDEKAVGIVVDEIEEVVHITGDQRLPAPDVGNPADRLLEGVANTDTGVTLLLNAFLIVGDDELDSLYETGEISNQLEAE